MNSCLFALIDIPSWIIAASGVATAYLAWATLSNKETLDELIHSNNIMSERLKIEKQEQYKKMNPYLKGIILNPTDPNYRALQITNIGSTIAELDVRNHRTNHYSIDTIKWGQTAPNIPFIEMIRFIPPVEFENIEFDFVYRGSNGQEVIQTFHKLPGVAGFIDPPQVYLAIE